jgi:hypothetical protein
MAHALPVFKLVSTFLKQASKPLAKQISLRATKHPQLSEACEFIGQQYHKISSRIHVMANGYVFIGVKPLPKEAALKVSSIDILLFV